jgi:hypothetical protein
MPKRGGRLEALLVSVDADLERRIRGLVRRLPPLAGAPVRVERAPGLRDRHGPVHAGSFLRERRIAVDCTRAEIPRIFVHELFHFVWLRAGNPVRLSYERLLLAEHAAGARGELGWSSEWRKERLTPPGGTRGRPVRGRRWREYCCESFCDTAAWLFGGGGARWARHREFTLAARFCGRRRTWFETTLGGRILSI